MTVPVWVSAKQNPSCENLVYALLDSQSDTTYIDKGMSDALQATMFSDKLQSLQPCLGKIQFFRVRGYQNLNIAYMCSNYIDLPTTYIKDSIPANHSHISTCLVAKNCNYLTIIADKVTSITGLGC